MSIDREELKKILEEVFEGIEMHNEHHEWIKERIEAEKARKEMCWEITKSVAQWSVIGLLGGAIYWFQNGHWPH